MDPGLDFFEIFVWIDFPEKSFPGLLPISAACHLGNKFVPYYRIRKGQSLFTAKMVEESCAAKAARGAERVYGILVRYTPKEGCMAPFPRAPDEPTAAAAVVRGTTIYLFPQADTLSACHNLYGDLNCPAFVCAPFDELVPNLGMETAFNLTGDRFNWCLPRQEHVFTFHSASMRLSWRLTRRFCNAI